MGSEAARRGLVVAGVRNPTAAGRSHRPLGRSPAHPFRVQLLGGFSATGDGGAIALPAASRRVLALAAVYRAPLPRTLAAERLWPHLSTRIAHGSLRTALSRLHAVQPALLAIAPDQVCLTDAVTVDLHEVEALAKRLITGSVPDADAGEPLDRLTLTLLPDCHDDWAILERDRLQDLFLHALEAHAERLTAGGEYAAALDAIHAAIAAEPLRESAACTLLAIHLAEGNRARAARCYLEFRDRLRTVLGIEPSAEMRAMVASLIPTT
ncbi:MAG: BTAD domain-containing putative transcriptional regulator [Dehalococcoidia bacterium]